MLNKKGLSPLVATILLVVFALAVGTATMKFGEVYVNEIPPEEGSSTSFTVNVDDLNPLKQLQIKYLEGRITIDEYLASEPQAIEKSKS